MTLKHPGAILVFALAAGFAVAQAAGRNPGQVPDLVSKIFAKNCTLAGCHQGRYPAQNLNLERGLILPTALNVPSQENPELKIIDAAAPEASYLLKKVRGDASIAGKRMPLDREALTAPEIQAIEGWISSLKETAAGAGPGGEPRLGKPRKPSFWGTRLINLPTGRTIDKGHFLFQISHRFFPPISDGWNSLFGLDGPGVILFGFGYGLSDRLSASIGRTNSYQEIILGANWRAFDQDEAGLPFSASISAGGGLITQSQPDRSLFDSRNMRGNIQLSLVRQINQRLSIMLVPGFTSNADQQNADPRGSFALGIGGRYMILDDVSLIAEWAPVLSGYKDEAAGWGFGIEKKIGGHVFQFFILNSAGLTPGQSIPGGDLKKDVRLGFNIFRTF